MYTPQMRGEKILPALFSRVGFCNISFKLYLQIFVQNMLSMPAKVIS